MDSQTDFEKNIYNFLVLFTEEIHAILLKTTNSIQLELDAVHHVTTGDTIYLSWTFFMHRSSPGQQFLFLTAPLSKNTTPHPPRKKTRQQKSRNKTDDSQQAKLSVLKK